MAGHEEFEVVIPVRVRDDTAEGAGEVLSSAERMRERVSSGSQRSFEESSRGSAKILNDFEKKAQSSANVAEVAFKKSTESARRESQSALGSLERVFNSHNFLLRSMAREAGARHLALALGVTKIGLAYKGMSKDVEDATLKSGRALEQLIRAQVISYSQLGNLAGKISSQNAERLGEFLTIQVGKLERSLTSVQGMLSKAEAGISRVQRGTSNKLEDFTRRLGIQFAGRIDTDFLKQFSAASGDAEKFGLLAGKLGKDASEAFVPIEKAALQFQILERNGVQALEAVESKANRLRGSVSSVESELHSARAALEKFTNISGIENLEARIRSLGQHLSGLRQNLSGQSATGRGVIPSFLETPIRDLEQTRNITQIKGSAFTNWADSLRPAQKEIAATEKELAALTQAGESAAGGLEGVGAAAGGMGASMIVVGGAIAAAVVVILAAVAALGLLLAVSWKSAEATAKMGDEIYRTEKATGLSAKTISTLRVVAEEMHIETKSLTETFGRLEAQISRGLTKPTTEAGRAIKTLKLDFKTLRDASPDEQFQMVSKALAGLNNENTKAHVATQLLGRDFARNSNLLVATAEHYTETQAKVRKLGLELDESGAVKSHAFTVALNDVTLAGQGLYVALGIKVLPALSGLITDITGLLIDQQGGWTSLADVAIIAIQLIRYEMLKLKYDVQNFWAGFKGGGGGLTGVGTGIVTGAFGDSGTQAGEQIAQEDYENAVSIAMETANLKSRTGKAGTDQFAPGAGKKGRHQETELERLQKEIRKLTGELKALQEVTSQEYELKFKVESFSRAKSGMEDILKLRYELGLQFNAPLPEFNVLGTKEEQTAQLEGIQQYVLQLNRLKTIFDGVRKTSNEQSDALAKLAEVQQEAYMPVVSASIRAETKYYEAIRTRRNAEQELTADVIVQSKLRAEAAKDEVGERLKAYQSLRLEFGKSQDEQVQQRLKDQIFIQVMRGGEDSIIKQLQGRLDENLQANNVPSEMTLIAQHAANIDSNVSLIALKVTGTGTKPVDYSTGNKGQLGTGNLDQPQILFEAGPGKVYTGRPGDNNPPTTNDAWSRVTMQTTDSVGQDEFAGMDEKDIQTETVNTNYIVRLREQIMRESQERIGGERDAATRKSVQNEIDAENRLGHQLIDLDQAVREQRATTNAQREVDERNRILSVIKLEDQLKDIQTGNVFEVKRQWDEAYASRLQHAIQLKDTIVQLEDANAHVGEDAADRVKVAYLSEINTVLEADTQAKESMARSSVQLANQTIFHAEQAQAKWLEFLSSQKGVTDIVSDSNIRAFNTTFDVIGSGLDRVLGKLGIAKDLVKELVLDWLRLAAAQLFGGGQQQQRQGGGFNLGGTASTILGGIFNSNRNVVGSVTGGFAGRNPVQQIFGSSGRNEFAGNLFGFGDGLTAPAGQTTGVGSAVLNAAGNAGTQAISTATRSGFSLSSIGQSLGPLAPLLGLSLGSAAGGGSGLSGILGGAGGLLLGGSIAASLGLFGGAFVGGGALGIGATVAPAVGGSGLLAGLGTFLLNPFTIGAAAALIIGAYLLNRNKQRRKDEELRAQILTDAKGKLQQILANVNADRMDGAEALAQAGQIRSDYLTQVGQIKDRKTRRIAEETVRELDTLIGQINDAVKRQDKRKEFEDKFTPTFAEGSVSGGSFTVNDYMYQKYHQFDPKPKGQGHPSTSTSDVFFGRVPGNYDRQDSMMARLSGDEVVLTPDVWRPIEGYLRSKNVPGFGVPTRPVYGYQRNVSVNGAYQDGGATFARAPLTSSTGNGNNGQINITVGWIEINAEALVFHGMKSSTNQQVVLDVVDKDIRINREDGVVLGGISEVRSKG